MAIKKFTDAEFWRKTGDKARDLTRREIFEKGKNVYGEKWWNGRYSAEYTIAKKSGTTVAALMKLNPGLKDPNKIRAGAGINLTDNSGTSTLQTNGANLRIGVDEPSSVNVSFVPVKAPVSVPPDKGK